MERRGLLQDWLGAQRSRRRRAGFAYGIIANPVDDTAWVAWAG